MNNEEKLAELRALQCRVDTLRAELGISPPGKVLYQSCRTVMSDDLVIVAADGFGGATTRIVEGNYPIDYCTNFEKSFASEKMAEAAAEQLVGTRTSPSLVLGDPI